MTFLQVRDFRFNRSRLRCQFSLRKLKIVFGIWYWIRTPCNSRGLDSLEREDKYYPVMEYLKLKTRSLIKMKTLWHKFEIFENVEEEIVKHSQAKVVCCWKNDKLHNEIRMFWKIFTLCSNISCHGHNIRTFSHDFFLLLKYLPSSSSISPNILLKVFKIVMWDKRIYLHFPWRLCISRNRNKFIWIFLHNYCCNWKALL